MIQMNEYKISRSDVLNISNQLKIILTEEEIDQVLEEYNESEENYPNDLWFEIVETIIYDIKG